MHHITLLRHGESEGNVAGLLQGQSDYPLSKAGIQQAHNLGAFWKSEGISFDLIISSPLVRASQTAKIISSCLTIPVEYESAWMERNFGQLQGESIAEIQGRIPPVNFFHPYDPIGVTGESQLDLYARACRALQSVLRYPAGSYLIVSHGGILNKALYAIMGITPQGHYQNPIFHFSNLGYAQLKYNPTSCQWAVISLNTQIVRSSQDGSFDWKTD